MNSNGSAHIVIEDIVIYPIKSCRGISLSRATICAQGLLYDHNFVIVAQKAAGDPFETIGIKQCPAFVHVQPSIEGSRMRVEYTQTGEFIYVDLEPDTRLLQTLPDTIKVWLTPHQGIHDLGPKASRFLKSVVRARCHDVKLCYKSTEPRCITGNMPPLSAQDGRKNIETALQSAFPLLITTHASLGELNTRLPSDKQMGMAPFRPNIVLKGTNAWDEDTWSKLNITSATGDRGCLVHLTARCGRCVVTTVDFVTAKLGVYPLKELRKYRNIDSGAQATSPVFGMYGRMCGTRPAA